MIKTSDFAFELPEDLIAQHPIEQRDASRLMCLDGPSGAIDHRSFYELPSLLRPDDCLVINNSRVIPARLLGVRTDSRTPVELLLLKRLNQTDWETLARPGRRVRKGHHITLMPGRLEAEVLDVLPNGNRRIRFFFDGIWETVLQEAGTCPLPPYIHEQLENPERYQTVYAEKDGSAAAPTAGLHFTPELMERLKENKIHIAPLTLHVGLGTFRPVRAENIKNHTLHEEYYELPEETVETIERSRQNGGRIIAVGTTSCRVLESVAARHEHLKAESGWTDIFIFPGFTFRVVDVLITNFHLPESTLIMLVSAFAGREHVLGAYSEAIRERYRFFSFGDAMLINRQ
jgi:S-adenosylmethionine:tRNA ribosyltransferase-isomerase